MSVRVRQVAWCKRAAILEMIHISSTSIIFLVCVPLHEWLEQGTTILLRLFGLPTGDYERLNAV